MGFSPEYTLNLNQKQINAYIGAIKQLEAVPTREEDAVEEPVDESGKTMNFNEARAVNEEKKSSGKKGTALTDEQAKKILDNQVARLKKEKGKKYVPSFSDLIKSGVV